MSGVRVEDWGTTSRGERVQLFTLEGDGIRARISSFGATLVSLEVADRRGDFTDVVLGFDTLAEYDSPRNPYFGGLVGRVANRIAGASFALDGKQHTLDANEGRHHLHGGLRGFDRVVWGVQSDATSSSLALRLRSPAGDSGYPGNVEVVVQYSTKHVRSFQSHFFASTDARTPLNLTQHVYFNLAGAGTIQDHRLNVHASRRVVVDDELIPTGELRAVDDSPFDFRTPRPIGERAASYDDCFALDGDRANSVAFACRLTDPRSGRVLEIDTNQPGLQLYTGQHLEGITGKRGASIPRFGGVCLETQHFPDSVHHAHFPSTIVGPGERCFQATQWRFSDA